MRRGLAYIVIFAALGCSDTAPEMLADDSMSEDSWASGAEPTEEDFDSKPETGDTADTSVLSGNVEFGEDEFGTTNLAPSASSGLQWTSDAWSNGHDRSFDSGTVDPDDSMLEMRGHGSLRIRGNGVASVSGRAPRIYIQRPDEKPIWQNVEVTYYAKLVSEVDPPSHAGFKVGARSWHGTRPFDDCNGKTYYGILRFDDNGANVTKELKHGTYAGQAGEKVWDRVPENRWIGVKLLVRDRPDGNVGLQFYRDMTGGADGGDWELIAEHVDAGDWATRTQPTGCSYGDTHVVRGKAPAVFARFDGVGRIDLRGFSVREVDPEFSEELFADVDPDSAFAPAIAWAKQTGLTAGCNPPDNTRFCPRDDVSRAQMATFLTRFLDLPASDADHFTDDDGSPHEANIDAIADARITHGCNPPDNTRFCPSDGVTRGQMAAFLARALSLPAADGDYFTDDDGSIFEDAINRLASSGLTAGCDDDAYCPRDTVTREQMVTFLYRAR